MKRAYCLYRVSTKKQVDKLIDDIPMQKTACHEFADRNGWVIVKEFSEKGISGFKVSANDRDAVQDLREAARSMNLIFCSFLCLTELADVTTKPRLL